MGLRREGHLVSGHMWYFLVNVGFLVDVGFPHWPLQFLLVHCQQLEAELLCWLGSSLLLSGTSQGSVSSALKLLLPSPLPDSVSDTSGLYSEEGIRGLCPGWGRLGDREGSPCV